MHIKTLYRGDERANVEAGSRGEAEMRAIGFADAPGVEAPAEPAEAPAAEDKPRRSPGRPRKAQ